MARLVSRLTALILALILLLPPPARARQLQKLAQRTMEVMKLHALASPDANSQQAKQADLAVLTLQELPLLLS